MHARTIVSLLACALGANAAVVSLYSDNNCQDFIASRNIYDNTCAPTGGFESYIITSGGGSGQYVTAYSPNSCSGATTACSPAGIGGCVQAYNSDGASNAIGSGPGCGVI